VNNDVNRIAAAVAKFVCAAARAGNDEISGLYETLKDVTKKNVHANTIPHALAAYINAREFVNSYKHAGTKKPGHLTRADLIY